MATEQRILGYYLDMIIDNATVSGNNYSELIKIIYNYRVASYGPHPFDLQAPIPSSEKHFSATLQKLDEAKKLSADLYILDYVKELRMGKIYSKK